MMSSMHATALFQWLQKAGAIVEDTWSARTMLTATSILPASSDLPTNQQAPTENEKSVLGPNFEPGALDISVGSSLDNQDLLDNFDFDSFAQVNGDFDDSNPTSFPPDGAETISSSKSQSMALTSKDKTPPINEYEGSPSGTSDEGRTPAELTQGFDADKASTHDHPPDELSGENDLDPRKSPIQKPSQPTKQPSPRLSAADLQGHPDRMKAAQEASVGKADFARPSNPTPAQAQGADGSPPLSWPHGMPISQGPPQLAHGQLQLPSQKKKKTDSSGAASEKAPRLESRLQRSTEIRLEAEGEARKIYEERLEDLAKLEDEVRDVLVLQEESKKKQEAEEALHMRMRGQSY